MDTFGLVGCRALNFERIDRARERPGPAEKVHWVHFSERTGEAGLTALVTDNTGATTNHHQHRSAHAAFSAFSLLPSFSSAKMSDSVVVKTRKFMKNPLLSRRQVS